jgi:Flp pilus assembly protein TadG
VSNRQRAYFRRLDDRGAVAPIVAMSLFALVGIAGVAFDYSRVAGMDSELQNGADQAALAGASQLDKDSGACARAANAAIALLSNPTLLANDDDGVTVKINGGDTVAVADDACESISGVTFYEDKDKTTVATTDADAAFIEVAVDARVANFAFTPIVGLFSSGNMNAKALAGLGSSVCKVPPMMICSPDPSVPFDAADKEGWGVVATGHSTGHNASSPGSPSNGSNTTWSPGDFGFLQVSESADTTNRNAALLEALAYDSPPIDCTPVGDNKVSTGNPQGLYDAINTRFDIYDFPSNSNSGNVLGSCQGADCPPASNVTKDFLNSNPGAGGNSCKIKNGGGASAGWTLPNLGHEYKPVAGAGPSYTANVPDVMGLPRDLCHYTSYNGTGLCAGGSTGRFGDGVWGRYDYFRYNHGSDPANWPSDWSTITRYQAYLWELGDYGTGGSLPTVAGQRSSPACYSGSHTVDASRRVLTVAVVKNCSSLTGAAQTVDIDEWVDVFLVEPAIDDNRRYNAFSDAVYLEIIGPSKLAGDGSYASQQVRRDVPYLVQ